MSKELDFVADLLGQFLAKEDPTDVAKILLQLDTTLPVVLHRLPGGMHADVVFQLFQLRDGPFGLLRHTVQDLGGIEVVARILNNSGAAKEREILNYLDKQDPELAAEIRNQMFTFEDIARMPDQDIEHLWDRVASADMALALRVVDEKVGQRLLSQMSASYRAQVDEAPASSGPVLRSVVEDAQLRILQQMRLLEQDGKVSIVRGDGGVGDYVL
ncbi:MAG: hypothetical protein HOM68_21300 [Gemmatimonadetes bacterium]|jgi:flagellar motor switch protein FliG|nr:hypothetical protein [Gemmatimonadota bacterium]MBT4612334.1 hypothetical protein [Gemmatimonadota bacterium]MBT5059094.1 hypothetical protein [Gemmatimonadota bacterium]MBT5145694.1 hypothetical protein [Gemmatimonadota bacterium]MBT5588076.1 hypothetical protein [Gemmatimonadota bacterium]